MIRIAIANLQRRVRLVRRELVAAVRAVLAGEGVPAADVSLAFVDDARIADLNEAYLRHQGPTDVIAFPLSDAGEELAGEVVVSAETAERVARQRGLDVRDELARYVIHGCLHLCGYDDRTLAGRRKMRRKEKVYLAGRGG